MNRRPPIATRQGRPAHENAPARKRASQVVIPFGTGQPASPRAGRAEFIATWSAIVTGCLAFWCAVIWWLAA